MSNGVYDLKWGQDIANQITNQVKEEVKAIRRVRPLIPVVAGGMAYVRTVADTTDRGRRARSKDDSFLDPGPNQAVDALHRQSGAV